MTRRIGRRGFVTLCATAAATVAAHPAVLASTDGVTHLYNRVKLVDGAGDAIGPAALEKGRSYIFNYPFATSPCFLLDLERPLRHGQALQTRDGTPYSWQGGVGPGASVVGFVAICTHKLSHPSKTMSFLNFHSQQVEYQDRDQQLDKGSGLIFCCSERSVYDPAEGARVLGGPAKEPLAAVLLEHDAEADTLFALGVYGGQQYETYFEKFGFRLAMEHGVGDARQRVTKVARVYTADEYSNRQMACV